MNVIHAYALSYQNNDQEKAAGGSFFSKYFWLVRLDDLSASS